MKQQLFSNLLFSQNKPQLNFNRFIVSKYVTIFQKLQANYSYFSQLKLIIYQVAQLPQAMSEDFQHILQDNICLKKALHTTRHQNDKLQQQLNELRFNYQQLLDKNTALNHTYNQFQKRNQLQMAEHNKDIATLTSQVEELKVLIQQKQQQLEAFQIRIIPNLDQDMIRVKLITEMEGPYQEAVYKKDREILKLKEKLSHVQRQFNVTGLQLETKEKQLKKELQQSKQFYQSQNSKLLKQLNNVLNRKEIKTYDKELARSQRRQLEQLRCTIDLQARNQMDLKKQLMSAKIQKQRILLTLSQLNQKKAMELHLNSDNSELRLIKQDKKRLEDQLSRKTQENQKLQKKVKSSEKQLKLSQDQSRRKLQKLQQQFQLQRQNLKEEIRKLKEQNRRMSGFKQRLEQENESILIKLKVAEKQNQLKNEEASRMRIIINQLEKTGRQYELAKRRKLSLSKDLKDPDHQIKPKRQEQTAKKQNNQRIINSKEDKFKNDMQQLQRANARLKEKLQKANKKIVELLKEKASLPKFASDRADLDFSISRDKAFSNIEIKNTKSQKNDNKALLLEYRDTSFIPLIPPTIYTLQK